MALRDSLKALGLTAAGAAVNLAQGGLGLAENFVKAASGTPDGVDKDENREDDSPEGGKESSSASQGMVPSDKDLAISDPSSMLWDPFAIIEQLGYKERPTAVTYGTLRSIMYKMPVITDIIQTRLRQLEAFARPQHDRYSMGFRLKLRDTEKEPSKQDKLWIRDMEKLVLHTGVCEDPRTRDNFKNFITKVMWDSLVYDQMAVEIVPNRKGQPSQWYAVDASTIRLADTASAYMKKKLRGDTKYVQIYDGMIISEYTNDEMAFGVRNPRTDLRLYGYGTAELEMIMSTITSLLWAWQYNQKFFSQGSATKGILNFKGAIPEHQLKGFRRHWYTMLCVHGDTVINVEENGEGRLVGIAEYLGDADTKPVKIWTGERYESGNVFTTGEEKRVCVTEAAGQSVRTSEEHRFLSEDGAWVEQRDLVLGDRVHMDSGKLATITRTSVTDEIVQMYDVSVHDDTHAFVADGFVVHNSGVENAWKTPITNADELQWISVMENNKDMEFNAWMDFQIKVGCAAFQMNPVEINFQYGNMGQKNSLSGDNNKEKITESKQRGLYPLLTFMAEIMNRHIIWPTNQDFELEFVGLDAGTQEDTAKLNQMRVKTTRTVDELRAEDDLEPMPDGLGEVILDPTWLQWAQQKKAEEMGLPPGADPNDPNAGNDPFGQDGEDGEGGGKDGEDDFDFNSLFADDDEEDASTKATEKATAKAKAAAQTKGKGERGNLGKSKMTKSMVVADRVGQTIGHVAKALVKINL